MSGGWFSCWMPPEGFVSPHAPDGFNHFRDLVDAGYTLFIVRHGSAPQFKVPEAVADVRRATRYIRLNAKEVRHRSGPHRRLRRQRGRAFVADAGHDGRWTAQRIRRMKWIVRAIESARWSPISRRSTCANGSVRTTSFPRWSSIRSRPNRSRRYCTSRRRCADTAGAWRPGWPGEAGQQRADLAALQKEKVPCDLLVHEGRRPPFSAAKGQAGVASADQVVR